MLYTTLGSTGLRISRLAFGAGPVAGLMIDGTPADQRAVVARAIQVGVNWFDTAAGYGDGQAERGLGIALQGIAREDQPHIATKVRLKPDQLTDISTHVRASVMGSLERLQVRRITLLQLHNSITPRRDDEPTSITPADVLGAGGVLEAFRRLREEGVVGWLGITAIGQPQALHQVVSSGGFHTIQVPYSLLNLSAGQMVPDDFGEANYGNIIAAAAEQNMGVFAIRVYSGGALAQNTPGAHTLRTKFFPLDLYERDLQKAARLADIIPRDVSLKEAALRFVFSDSRVSSAIIGFSTTEHVDEALASLEAGPLPNELVTELREFELQRI